jgi:hypothetical protein
MEFTFSGTIAIFNANIIPESCKGPKWGQLVEKRLPQAVPLLQFYIKSLF